jgi:hypothetical protein
MASSVAEYYTVDAQVTVNVAQVNELVCPLTLEWSSLHMEWYLLWKHLMVRASDL